MKSFVRLAALAAVVLGARGLAAQESQHAAAKTPSVTLGELSVLQVLTASKTLESASEAPGIISTITAEEIRRLGSSSLLEVLEHLPGAYALTSSVFPWGTVTTRGMEMAEVSNRVLVLLNGRPVRESTHGAMNMAILSAMPLETIERIEMVRGPGSVLYGTNAFAGVINVITKDGSEPGVTTSVGYGSFNSPMVSTQGGFSRGDLSVAAGAKYAREDRSHADGAFNLGEDLRGASVLATYKRLTFTAFGGVNTMGRYDSTADMHTRHLTADAGYEHPVADWWDASFNATYNYTHNTFQADEHASDYVLETTNHLRLPRSVNLIVGGLAYGLTGRGERLGRQHLPEYSEVRWSGYSQLDVHPAAWLKLIAGGQVNKVEGHRADFVPRVGAIVNATSALGAKLLYGKAFRSPFAVEQSIRVPNIIAGNPDLSPEKVATLDAQAFYNTGHVQLAATYFHSTLNDLILLLPGQGVPGVKFVNRGRSEMRGIELESKVRPTGRLTLSGSYVHQIAHDTAEHRIPTFVPSRHAKAGVTYEAAEGVTLSAFDSYFNAPTVAFTSETKVEAAHFVTAKASFDVTRLLGAGRATGVAVDLSAANLLGADVNTPMTNERGVASPRITGRTFTALLRLSR
jgi:outer membrane receptor protein involved in Fe transport